MKDENAIRRIVREELERALQFTGVPIEPLTPERRYMTVEQSALISGFHRQTVAEALRAGVVHGNQRIRKGKWRIRVDCLYAWMEKRPCEHQGARNAPGRPSP